MSDARPSVYDCERADSGRHGNHGLGSDEGAARQDCRRRDVGGRVDDCGEVPFAERADDPLARRVVADGDEERHFWTFRRDLGARAEKRVSGEGARRLCGVVVGETDDAPQWLAGRRIDAVERPGDLAAEPAGADYRDLLHAPGRLKMYILFSVPETRRAMLERCFQMTKSAMAVTRIHCGRSA